MLRWKPIIRIPYVLLAQEPPAAVLAAEVRPRPQPVVHNQDVHGTTRQAVALATANQVLQPPLVPAASTGTFLRVEELVIVRQPLPLIVLAANTGIRHPVAVQDIALHQPQLYLLIVRQNTVQVGIQWIQQVVIVLTPL